jgi:hypothetical protein
MRKETALLVYEDQDQTFSVTILISDCWNSCTKAIEISLFIRDKNIRFRVTVGPGGAIRATTDSLRQAA